MLIIVVVVGSQASLLENLLYGLVPLRIIADGKLRTPEEAGIDPEEAKKLAIPENRQLYQLCRYVGLPATIIGEVFDERWASRHMKELF